MPVDVDVAAGISPGVDVSVSEAPVAVALIAGDDVVNITAGPGFARVAGRESAENRVPATTNPRAANSKAPSTLSVASRNG